MKKLVLVMIGMFFFASMGFAQHIDGDGGKTYYDEAKTKLKEVYNYKEAYTFSNRGDQTITETKKVRHGPYFYYYESGKIKISGNYKDGKKHGSWKYFDEEGNTIKEEEYVNGEKK